MSLNASDVCSGSTESLSDYKYVLYLGLLLLGAGSTPLYTLGTFCFRVDWYWGY